MKRVGLTELNAVVAVANHRSFRKAAEELEMSTSALSHAISTLEQQMGVRLFNRTTRSVAPSEAGDRFLSRIAPALAEIGAAINDVEDFRETPSGTIRLNASEGAARMLMTPIVLEFLRRYPLMQVDLVTEGRLVDIVAEGFDAGIRATEHVPLDMVAMPCSAPIRFVVVGSPDYFAKRGEPRLPDDLRHHDCVRSRLPSGALYSWEFQRGSDYLVVEPLGRLTLDNHHLMVDAALENAGLIWTDEWHVAHLIASGRLRTTLEDWSPYTPALSLYYPSHRHLPAGMRAFVNLVRETYVKKMNYQGENLIT